VAIFIFPSMRGSKQSNEKKGEKILSKETTE
jgi:hypothetical protein